MGHKCQVCISSKRIQIDRELVAGAEVSGLARKYGISDNSLYNHRDNHLTRQMLKSQELRDVLTGRNLIHIIEDLLTSAQNILAKTENKPSKYNTALKAISECRSTIQLLFEIAVKLKEVKDDEHTKGRYDDMIEWKELLKHLEVEEIETIQNLLAKAKRKASNQGRRTDLEPKRSGPPVGWNHPQAQRTVEEKRKRKRRRKPPVKKVNEFDAMRDKLGMDNNPEPREKGWMSP